MNKIVIGGIVVVLLAVVWWQFAPSETVEVLLDEQHVVVPGHESAELTAFGFMQDLLAAAPGEGDGEAEGRLYEALSQEARAQVDRETLLQDIALFVGIQGIPEQGVSVENLEVQSDTESTLIVGLNFSNGRELRAIDMVVEDGEWKVHGVRVLDMYPPEDERVPTPVPTLGDGEEIIPNPGADDDRIGQTEVRNGCFIGGCSGQLCTDNSDVISTCEWRDEYQCYRSATCERQADGECGWTETEDLLQCLAEAQTVVE